MIVGEEADSQHSRHRINKCHCILLCMPGLELCTLTLYSCCARSPRFKTHTHGHRPADQEQMVCLHNADRPTLHALKTEDQHDKTQTLHTTLLAKAACY